MPQRDRSTGCRTNKLLVGTFAILMLLQIVFAVDTVLSNTFDNYQTIDENTSLLHTNTEITNQEFNDFNFDITNILNDGELVSNFDITTANNYIDKKNTLINFHINIEETTEKNIYNLIKNNLISYIIFTRNGDSIITASEENSSFMDSLTVEVNPDAQLNTIVSNNISVNNLNAFISSIHNMNANMQLSTPVLQDLLFMDFDTMSGKIDLPYTDIKQDDEFSIYIQNVFDHDIELGMTDSVFFSKSEISRASIVSAIYALEDSPSTEFKAIFTDVAESDRNAEAITWASENDIIFGIGGNLFAPYDTITLEEISAILHRYATYKDADNEVRADISNLADYANISDYAIENIEWALGNDIIENSSDDDDYLLPNKKLTRGESAVIISKYIDLCHID